MTRIKAGASRHSVRASRLAVLLLSGAGVAALAQGSALAAEAAAAADTGAQVEEVVVTANRSGAENLQNVAMAITAVNADTLDKGGATTFQDLSRYTPSLSITQSAPGFNKFDMRGLTTGAYRTSDTSDRSLVAVYLDDTPISVQGQTPDLRVYDLERVEVLAGPQGTLYGAGSMAGTVRFITAKPSTSAFFGTLEVIGSSTEHGSGNYSLRGMINIPVIADKLAIRATVYQGEDSGFISNIGDRNKLRANLDRTTQARVAARWTPTSRLTIDASVTYEKSRAYGLDQQLSGLAPYTISSNGPEGDRDDFQLYNVTGAYDLGFADLVSSSSYTWRRIGFQASPDPQIGYFFQNYGSGLPVGPGAYPLFNQPASYNQAVTDLIPQEDYLITQKVHDFMQEVRLVSKNDGPIKWTVGAFYEHQRRNLYQDIPTPGFDTLSYENFFYGPFNTPNGKYNSQTVDGAFNPNDIFSGLQNTTEHQFAVFTDDTWHVTKKLDVTAGVRYFDFHERYFLFEGGVYGVINHVPLTQNSQLSSHDFNPRFNVSYHATDDIMVYAEAAKGFRYGGANQPVPLGTSGVAGQCTQNLASYGFTAAPATFGPDHLWSYSVGEKARLADGRVTLNTDAYFIDWSNVQTRLLLNCSYFFTVNAGTVHSYGVESEGNFRVTRELTLAGSLSYNDSRAAGNIPTVGAFNGDLAPYYPRWIIGLSAYYDRPIFNGELHAQVSWQHRGDEHTTFNPLATSYNAATNTLTATGPSQTFAVIPTSDNVDAAVSYAAGRYEIGVFGKNLADGVTVTDIGRATYYKIYQAGDRETVARPRTVGARLKVKF
ncbi:MAG TPA: TonB-dependent receptor [Caulobacteraceae bacterium]|nr:TonB-dependent receptor [Caulobacteraceae bacterium]